jgi:hypothetical protein
MMRSRVTWWNVVCVLACVLFSYVVRRLIERLFVGRIGPFWAYVALGDVVGYAALGALTRWRIGIVLLVLLDIVEAILLRTHVLSPTAMMWVADAVPTLDLVLPGNHGHPGSRRVAIEFGPVGAVVTFKAHLPPACAALPSGLSRSYSSQDCSTT